VVKVSAEDWNDNEGETSITLKDPGNEIPSFGVVPDNKQVALSWNDVPGANGYTVHYTTNGTPPSISYGKKIEDIATAYTADNPLIIDELENGNMHVFLLQAHSDNPSDMWLSDNEEAIPLSPLTLAPGVTGEYQQIRVAWRSIPATDYFEVLRAETRDGEYLNISGIIDATSFTDTAVEDGQMYFYEVRPSFTGSIESEANCGQTSPFTFSQEIDIVGMTGINGVPVNAITTQDGMVYTVDMNGWLSVIDASDRSNPAYLSSVPIPAGGIPTDIAADDDYIYITGKFGMGFHILNRTNLSSLSTFGGLNLYGLHLDTDGGYAYTANLSQGITRFSTPLPPPPVPEYWFSPGAFGVGTGADDVYAYLLLYTGILHVADKASGMSAGSYSVGPSMSPLAKVHMSDSYLCYVHPSSPNIFSAVDLSDFSVKTYPVYLSYPTNLFVHGSYAYVTDRNSGLHVINLFPDSPLLISFLGLPYANCVAVSGKYAYIGDYSGSLWIVDISTSVPGNPSVTATYPDPGTIDARRVAVSGDYAYATCGDAGLKVLDISTQGIFTDAGSCDTPGIAAGVAVSGDYAFVLDEDDPATPIDEQNEQALQIIDLTDLSGPVGSVGLQGVPYDIAVMGNFAFIADGAAGLQIIDVSSPDDPETVGFRSTPGSDDSQGVAVRGNYAYVASGTDGLYVLDVTTPNNPIIIKTFAPGGQDFRDVAISGNYAYVADDSTGLRVLDISFPNNVIEVGSCNTSGTAESVVIGGNYAFLADGTQGVQVIDISDPTTPTVIGECQLPGGSAVDVTVTGEFAYAVDGTAGTVKEIDLLTAN
jgi:hypothetical protein